MVPRFCCTTNTQWLPANTTLPLFRRTDKKLPLPSTTISEEFSSTVTYFPSPHTCIVSCTCCLFTLGSSWKLSCDSI